MITLALIIATAYLAFNVGRRYDVGQREATVERVTEARVARGRRGAMKLRPIRIRR